MAATWDEILQDASWKGIPFGCASIRTEGGYEIDKREYPNRDGAELVPLARKAATLQVRAVFVDEAYPEEYERFLAALAAGGVGELVHPVHGSIQAAADHWTDATEPDDSTDFGAVEVQFVEHTDNALGPFQGTDAASLANLVRSACDDVDVAAVKLQAYVDSLEGGAPAGLQQAATEAPAIAASFAASATTLEEDGDTMIAAAVVAEVNAALATAGSSLALVADFVTVEAQVLSAALVACCARLSRLGEAIISARPPLIEAELPAGMPLLVFVHYRYGDSSRGEEVLRLNPSIDALGAVTAQPLVIYAT